MAESKSGFQLFGFEIKRKSPDEIEMSTTPSFAPVESDDGALVVSAGGSYGTYLDLEGSAKTEADLVSKYREMSIQPECESAINEIVDEVIVKDENKEIVDINLDNLEISDSIKDLIIDEWNNVTNLLDFNNYGYEIFRRWYIDGRIFYHVIIDDSNPRKGIVELRYIDPRKMRKVRNMKRERRGNVFVNVTTDEFFMYTERSFKGNSPTGMDNQGLKITKDSIIHITSGLMDKDNKLVLSYLHKAIKPLNQLRMLEDSTVIYRISRAPERRIFYIDVGNLPKMKAEQYIKDMMNKHKNRLVYDAVTGDVKDDRKFMCFALDTKIPLLDGRTLTLENLISEYEQGKENWVYSCDPETGKFSPGPVSWAGITKKNSSVVKVTLDNGKSVICTPDHKFPVWNKGMVEAQYLTVGESLIPGYRRSKEITPGGALYEQLYQNETGTWEYTHRLVSAWKNENNFKEEMLYSSKYIDDKKTIIHHLDFNRNNNSPRNLVYMNHKDHIEYHHDIQSIVYTLDVINAVKEAATNLYSVDLALKYINKLDLSAWINSNSDRNPKNRLVCSSTTFTAKDLNRVSKNLGFAGYAELRKSCDTRIRTNSGKIRVGSTKGSDEHYAAISNARTGRVSFAKTWNILKPDGSYEIVENLSAFCRERDLNRSNIKGKYGSKGYSAEILVNHKVVSVEFLEETMDVGCITIDKNETYHSNHTYLLDIGVYTKNTMMEDYWLARRDGNKGTEISTLPSGQNLGEMADVQYFQKKLYKSLSVPMSRIDPETTGFNMGRSTEITQDELKFQKFINRLRLRFSQMFLQILEKQLILKGIITSSDWAQFKNKIHFNFHTDNYFSELKDAEILRERLSTLAQIEPYIGIFYSREWIKKNVLKQSDEDIAQMNLEISQEPPPPSMMQDPNGDPGQEATSGSAEDQSQPNPEAESSGSSSTVPLQGEIVQGKNGPFTRKSPERLPDNFYQ